MRRHYSYKPVLPYLDRLDFDVITFGTADNDGAEFGEIAAAVSTDKKICIDVASHSGRVGGSADPQGLDAHRSSPKLSGTKMFWQTNGFGRRSIKRTFASSSPLTPATESGLCGRLATS